MAEEMSGNDATAAPGRCSHKQLHTASSADGCVRSLQNSAGLIPGGTNVPLKKKLQAEASHLFHTQPSLRDSAGN